ncbi:19261_t:CDS:2 [Racocetra fulgida]|uniref:19261_t:CDS:1 n=1 Tax=Racocetra fulgida TaxID=60492 RepID=A0A9N8Z4G6_9GLOM|nr:19261_t:CDS:2 [Racocetra fulgida]
MQLYDTVTVSRHELGSMNVECSHCYALYWIDEKVAGSVFNPVFSTCCVNGKVQLPIINQPPEPLLSLLIEKIVDLLTQQDIENCSLHILDDILMQQSKTLKDFPKMPIPNIIHDFSNRLLNDELNYDQLKLCDFLEKNIPCLNEDQ